MEKYGYETPLESPVFIVGAPRSGTTILYQLITYATNCVYFDNLVNLARELPLLGVSLSQRWLASRPHNSFNSIYGNTTKSGLHAPSEAGQLWHRLLHSNAQNFKAETYSTQGLKQTRKIIYSILNKYNKPIVTKNTYNSLRLELLAKLHPKTKIIFVTRDPFYTAQSIFLARQKWNQHLDDWWGVKSPNYQELKNKHHLAQIVGQVYDLEKHIVDRKKLFPVNNWLDVHYEELLNLPTLSHRLSNFLATDFFISTPVAQKIKVQNKVRVKPNIAHEIHTQIALYDWVNYSSLIT